MTFDELEDDICILEPREHFDACIVGVSEQCRRLIYSTGRIINMLMEVHGMDAETAVDHFYYNIVGTHVEGWSIFQSNFDAGMCAPNRGSNVTR